MSMKIKQARKMALSGEPVTKSEYDAAYSALTDASLYAALWMAAVFMASLSVVWFMWYSETMNVLVIVVLVALNLVCVSRAAAADVRIKFLIGTANIF